MSTLVADRERASWTERIAGPASCPGGVVFKPATGALDLSFHWLILLRTSTESERVIWLSSFWSTLAWVDIFALGSSVEDVSEVGDVFMDGLARESSAAHGVSFVVGLPEIPCSGVLEICQSGDLELCSVGSAEDACREAMIDLTRDGLSLGEARSSLFASG